MSEIVESMIITNKKVRIDEKVFIEETKIITIKNLTPIEKIIADKKVADDLLAIKEE